MMNENNDVFTMEDEPIASVMQNMRKGSKWLSAFLESYRPPLDGERYLTDGEVSELLPCEPTHLARIPQQPRVALYPFGREGALPGNGAARGAGSELPQAVMMLIL
uniref:Uncharacterized protein n=1 Tax=Bacteroides thetaiotaomicron TaxID=818 RepID=Q93L47_BACT4|nr:hypothetical protein [Bacteroides thetaiotaomicron]